MKRILVVDDEQDILDALATLLRRSGYGVWTASTGEEGLQIAKKEKPDLVILDLILPDKDGSDVAAELLDFPLTRDIPVIFLTCMIRKEEQVSDGTMIANRCIVAKPCRSDEILGLIKDRIGPA